MEATAAIGTTLFADRLAAAVERKRSQLLAGLDPRPEQFPLELRGEAPLGPEQAAAACTRFCYGVIDAVAPYVVGVKPQIAFFEALGHHGVKSFEDVCAYARAADLMVLDRRQARRHRLDRARVRLGISGATERRRRRRRRDHRPHVSRPRVARAVPPGRAAERRGDLLRAQDLERRRRRPGPEALGRPPALAPARRAGRLPGAKTSIGDCGLSSVGAVVGATHPREVGEARRLLPQAPLLLPGSAPRAQRRRTLRARSPSGPASALVSVSRSLIYAFRSSDLDWRTATGAEAARLQREVWAISGW